MESLRVETVNQVLKERKKIININLNKDINVKEKIEKSLELLKSVEVRDANMIGKLKKEMSEKYNAIHDMEYYLGRLSTSFNSDKFYTLAIPLDDGAIVIHSETIEATQIIDVNNFEGILTKEGKINILSANVYDKNDNIVFENYINIVPAENMDCKVIFEKERIDEFRDCVNKEKLVEISIKGFKNVKKDKEKDMNFEIDYEKIEEIIQNVPSNIPDFLRSFLIRFNINRYKEYSKKKILQAHEILQYTNKVFDSSILINIEKQA